MDNIYEFTIQKFLKSDKALPEDLEMLVRKFQKVAVLLSKQSQEVQTRLAPIVIKSAAFIAAELQREYDRQPKGIDKRKKLELEAKALELLQKQYQNRK